MKTTKTSRRQFLAQSSSIVTASSAFSSYVSAKTGSKKIGVALAGLGYYSRDLLAPALQLTKHCELRGIITGSSTKIPIWQQQYGIPDNNVYSYETMHQAANNGDIDVIYVVTPTGLHAKHAIIAASAGKHVWCEKPMAMTVKECTSIINTCKKNDVRLSIGYRMQHESNTQTIISYAKSRPYGKIEHLVIKAGYRGGAPEPGNWRLNKQLGGGALRDMGVYTINGARYATGLEPISVFASTTTQRKEAFKEVDETSYLTLEFPNGITADCTTSVGQSMNELRAQCERGWYELTPMQTYSNVRGRTSDGTRLNKITANQQAVQMDNDALAILGHRQIIVPGEEGLKDIRVIEAAFKSAETGKVIQL